MFLRARITRMRRCTAFEPRRIGGSAQRFCAAPCRRAFDRGCRVYAAREILIGRLPVSALAAAVEQRAHSLGRDLRLERPQTPAKPRPCPGAPQAAGGANPLTATEAVLILCELAEGLRRFIEVGQIGNLLVNASLRSTRERVIDGMSG